MHREEGEENINRGKKETEGDDGMRGRD